MKKRFQQILPLLIMFGMALIIIGSPLLKRESINGVDTLFHMSATYEAARQIQTGHFSYFLSIFSFAHSGRIVNALYGPLGGYFSGLLLVLSGSWFRWEMLLNLIILVIAGCSMYQLTNFWQVNWSLKYLISFLYMMTPPVMGFVWGLQFDGVGAAMIPWLILIASRWLVTGRLEWLKLTFLMFLIAETHVFTVILSALAFLPCLMMALWIHRRHWQTVITQLLMATGLTLVLTFNVWGSILEVMSSNHHHFIPVFPVANMDQNPNDTVLLTHQIPINQNLSIFGCVLTFWLVLISIIYLLDAIHLKQIPNLLMIFLGFGFIWLSTEWFPWRWFQKRFPILDTDLQFPKRFMAVGLTIFLLILAIMISQFRRAGRYLPGFRWLNWAMMILVVLTVGHTLMTAYGSAQIAENRYQSRLVVFSPGLGSMSYLPGSNPQRIRNAIVGPNYGELFRWVAKPSPDYLPSNRSINSNAKYYHLHPYGGVVRQIYHNRIHPKFCPGNHHSLLASFKASGRRKIILPVVKYAHTQVWLNGRQIRHPPLTKIGALVVRPQFGINHLQIRYQPAIWYLFGILISLVSWLILIGWLIFRTFRYKKQP